MKDVMKYKNQYGSVHYDSDDNIFFGKIEGINDLITYEGRTVDELNRSFREAVEDYLHICQEHDKPVYKSYKGSLNIRIPEELHRKAVFKALSEGVSLNQLIREALQKELVSG